MPNWETNQYPLQLVAPDSCLINSLVKKNSQQWSLLFYFLLFYLEKKPLQVQRWQIQLYNIFC